MYQLIAHRGASSEAPENTLAAVRRALEIGVDCIEVDVHLSHDGHPVVIHDPVAGRTAWGAAGKRISEMPLAEIKGLDAGSWFGASFSGEPVPTLDELLQIPRASTGLMIEIKRGHTALERLGSAVIKSIHASPQDLLMVGSYSAALLLHMQKKAPALALAGIVENQHLLNSFQGLKLKRMVLWYKLLSPYLVANLHDEGLEVWTFTVDDLKVAQFLLSIGVDGIITNNPRFMKEALKNGSSFY